MNGLKTKNKGFARMESVFWRNAGTSK